MRTRTKVFVAICARKLYECIENISTNMPNGEKDASRKVKVKKKHILTPKEL